MLISPFSNDTGICVHLHVFLSFFHREIMFETSFCFFTLQVGSTFKGKSSEFAPRGANSFLEELNPI